MSMDILKSVNGIGKDCGIVFHGQIPSSDNLDNN
jgi:hypothetical protein